MFKIPHNLPDLFVIAALIRQDGCGVPCETYHLESAHMKAEMRCCRIFQAMGLVHDERFVSGNNFPESGLLHRQIRSQEVVIHHHQIGLHGSLTHLVNEALFPVRAFLSQAGLRIGIDLRPRGIVVGQAVHLGPVAFSGADGVSVPLRYLIE